MSSNLMDTEPGGESTQYESITSTAPPHQKQGGQMSTPQTTARDSTRTSDDHAARGARTAENMRYGQTISEGGMGGQTDMAGQSSARTEGAYGRSTEASDPSMAAASDDAAAQRRAEGYGGDKDMDRNVGA